MYVCPCRFELSFTDVSWLAANFDLDRNFVWKLVKNFVFSFLWDLLFFFFVFFRYFSRSLSCQGNEAKYELSYVCGPGSRPLSGLTLGKLLDLSGDRYTDREAVVSVHQDLRKTFADIKEDADKLAAGFLSLGLERGDRIGIWGPNSYEWYLTQLAAGKAGLILVRIDFCHSFCKLFRPCKTETRLLLFPWERYQYFCWNILGNKFVVVDYLTC